MRFKKERVWGRTHRQGGALVGWRLYQASWQVTGILVWIKEVLAGYRFAILQHPAICSTNRNIRPTAQQHAMYMICFTASGVPVITSLTYGTATGLVTCLSEGGPVTAITWNRVGLKTTTLLNTELATYQNNLTITGTNISDYTEALVAL